MTWLFGPVLCILLSFLFVNQEYGVCRLYALSLDCFAVKLIILILNCVATTGYFVLGLSFIAHTHMLVAVEKANDILNDTLSYQNIYTSELFGMFGMFSGVF